MVKERLDVVLGGKTEQVAQEWNAMSSNEYLQIANYLYEVAINAINPDLARMQVAQILMHQVPTFWADLYNGLDAEDSDKELLFGKYHQTICNLFNFVIKPIPQEDGGFRYDIVYGRTKLWKEVREIKIDKHTKWIAPADGLDNISFWEWVYISPLLEGYTYMSNKGHYEEAERMLSLCFGALWRPKAIMWVPGKSDQDPRKPLFDFEHEVEERAKKWDFHLKMMPDEAVVARRGLLFWLQSCRMAIIEKYPNVFSQGGDSSADYQELVIRVAGGPDVEVLGKWNVHNVLKDLDIKAKDAKQLKDRQK